MDNILNKIKDITPVHFEDLLVAMETVSEELEYTKAAIDKQVQNCIGRNDYDAVRDLLEVSEAIYIKKEYITNLIEKFQVQEEKDYVEETQYAYINYDAYRVDEMVEYDLFSEFTHKKPAALLFEERKYNVSSWKSVLILICEILYKKDKELFTSFIWDKSMQGRKKPKFSQDRNSLRKAVQILNSGIYAEINLSANDIRKQVLKMLEKYDIDSDNVKLYLAKDLSPLHENR